MAIRVLGLSSIFCKNLLVFPLFPDSVVVCHAESSVVYHRLVLLQHICSFPALFFLFKEQNEKYECCKADESVKNRLEGIGSTSVATCAF